MYSLGVMKSSWMAGMVLKRKLSMHKEGKGFMDNHVTKSGEVVMVR